MSKTPLHEGWHYRRGDIYLVDLDPAVGSEQGGVRPVLVIQNNIGNHYSPTLIVAVFTSQMKKLSQPTHMLVEKHPALEVPSVLMFEQIDTIDKKRILGYLGHLNPGDMRIADRYIKSSLALNDEKKENLHGNDSGNGASR